MYGFKSIDEFTFDDCYTYVKQCLDNDVEPDADITDLHSRLKDKLKKEDDALFDSLKSSIKGCNKYLKIPPKTGVKYYKKTHIEEALKVIHNIKEQNVRIRNRWFAFILILSFLITTIVGLFTYKSRYHVSVPTELRISQYGDTVDISKFIMDVSSDRLDIWFNENNTDEAFSNQNKIYRNDNQNSYIIEEYFCEYADKNWPNKIPSNGLLIFPMNISTNEHSGIINIKTWIEIFGYRLFPEIQQIKIIQEKSNATFLRIINLTSKWCFNVVNEKSIINANSDIYINVSNDGIKNDMCDLFIESDGTYIQFIEDADWISIEKKTCNEDRFHVNLMIDKNRTSENRSGVIKILSGNEFINIHISQVSGYAKHLSVDKECMYLSSEEVWEENNRYIKYGSYYSIKISTDGIWDYKFDYYYDWIKAIKYHDDEIMIQVKENNDEQLRSAVLIISTLNMGEKRIVITQFEN